MKGTAWEECQLAWSMALRRGAWGDTLGNAVGTRPYKALTATTGLLDIIYRLGLQGWCVVGVL